MKYVVMTAARGAEIIVTFSDILTHADVADSLCRVGRELYHPVSAGFTNGSDCWGVSISLDLKSRPDVDTALLTRGY